MAGTRDGGDPPGGDTAVAAGRDTPPATGDEASAKGDVRAASRCALAVIFREEGSRLTASMMRVLGDFDAAEEVVQDALLAAWQQWPVAAWLGTKKAKDRVVQVLHDAQPLNDWLAKHVGDSELPEGGWGR